MRALSDHERGCGGGCGACLLRKFIACDTISVRGSVRLINQYTESPLPVSVKGFPAFFGHKLVSVRLGLILPRRLDVSAIWSEGRPAGERGPVLWLQTGRWCVQTCRIRVGLGERPATLEGRDEGRDHSTTGCPRMWKGLSMRSGFGHTDLVIPLHWCNQTRASRRFPKIAPTLFRPRHDTQ